MKWIVLVLVLLVGLAAAVWAAQPESPNLSSCKKVYLTIGETETHTFYAPIYQCLKVEA